MKTVLLKSKTSKFRLISTLLFTLSGIITLQAQSGQWNIKGTSYEVDTVVSPHKVGPGVTYAKYRLPHFPLNVFVMEVDLNNEYVSLEAANGGEYAYSIETLPDIVKRYENKGLNVVGAINSDLSSEANDPAPSGMFRNYEMITSPIGWANMVLDENGVPHIDQLDFNGSMIFKGETLPVSDVNGRTYIEDTSNGDVIDLYTDTYGPQTNAGAVGKKVIISPKSGAFKWYSNTPIECVVESVSDCTGASEIPSGKAVLWVKGAYVDKFSADDVAQELTIILGVELRHNAGAVKLFKESTGGFDQIFLNNGEYDSSVVWEDRHPRSCGGYSEDKSKAYLVIIDGRTAASVGTTLSETADIFKALGIYKAQNFDGGGSSTMVIRDEVVNYPSGGALRAVSNGWMAVSLAPEDDEITQIEFAPRNYNVPIMAKFKPVIYAYNRYGSLCNTNLNGVKISCDEHIGTINSDNEFTATSDIACGFIYAEYNGITTKQLVSTKAVEVSLVNSSYIVDNQNYYPIKMTAQIGEYDYDIDAGAIEWSVADESVCTIKDGKVMGLKNGTTEITGTSSVFNGKATIVVEIPECEELPFYEQFNVADWTLKQTGGTGITISENGTGFDLKYTGAGGRSPYIAVSNTLKTYGLPSSIIMEINPKNAPVKKVSVVLTDQYGNRRTQYLTETALEANKEAFFTIALRDAIFDNSIFPITLSDIRFDMGTSTTGIEYTISVKNLYQQYWPMGGVENVIDDNNEKVSIFPNPIYKGETVRINAPENSIVKVYSINGVLIDMLNLSGDEVDTSALNKGIYLIRVETDDSIATAKLIVK